MVTGLLIFMSGLIIWGITALVGYFGLFLMVGGILIIIFALNAKKKG